MSDYTQTESVFAKLMEQVELNQPVVFEVNEALAGLSAKQVAIEVEDEEEKIEGEKNKKTEAGKMLPPSISPTPKPKKSPQEIVKSEEKKPAVNEDDEKERKKSRYEFRPSRPEDGEMVPKELLSVPVSQEAWNVLGKDEEFVEGELLLLPAEGA